MSGEQLRKVLHFSKRKIAYLIQNGYIKAIDTKKRSHRYLIKKEDVDVFFKKLNEDPFFISNLSVKFTAVTTGIAKKKKHNIVITEQDCRSFKAFLSKKWRDVPDALMLEDVAKLVGTTRKSLNYVCERNKIVYIMIRNRRVCTKDSVIEYYSSLGVLRNPIKSETFTNLLLEYKSKQK